MNKWTKIVKAYIDDEYTFDKDDVIELEFDNNDELIYNYNGKQYFISRVKLDITKHYVEDQIVNHYMLNGEDQEDETKRSVLDDIDVNDILELDLYNEDDNEVIEIKDKNIMDNILKDKESIFIDEIIQITNEVY